MLTDYEKILRNIDEVREAVQAEDFNTVMSNIRYLVGRNQNRPPQGEADGSISEEDWTAARDMVRSFEEMLRSMNGILRRSVGRRKL